VSTTSPPPVGADGHSIARPRRIAGAIRFYVHDSIADEFGTAVTCFSSVR
jgi:hypothetical protein